MKKNSRCTNVNSTPTVSSPRSTQIPIMLYRTLAVHFSRDSQSSVWVSSLQSVTASHRLCSISFPLVMACPALSYGWTLIVKAWPVVNSLNVCCALYRFIGTKFQMCSYGLLYNLSQCQYDQYRLIPWCSITRCLLNALVLIWWSFCSNSDS